jgi:hypothetical protein
MTLPKDELESTIESNQNQKKHNEISTTPNQSNQTTSTEQTPPKRKKIIKKFFPTVENIPTLTIYQLLIIKIIGLLLIIGGILVFFNIIQGTQKLSIILLTVGIVFTFFISIKNLWIPTKDNFIALALLTWIIASYLITFQAESEILFIFLLLGFLIINEFSQEYISKSYQKRLHFMLFFFLMVFFLIIAEKILTILHS